jgi:hypothetical protein
MGRNPGNVFGNMLVGNDDVPQNRPSVNITPKDLKTLECEECHGVVFAEGIIIKTVSALLTGTGKEGMVPIPAFYCIKCKTVVDKYLPEDMRKTKLVSP